MGEKLLEKIQRIKSEYKFAFVCTMLLGMCVHMYKFTNTLLGHDSVLNYYSDQNILTSGRWFLSLACGISSFFDLPWITGIFSILYISLAVVLLVKMFDCKNRILIFLISGLMVSFPAVTETFFYQYTADGYMLAMLFAVESIQLTKMEDKRWINYIVSTILLILCCGIYQSYLCFALVLTICYFIWVLFEKEYKIGELVKWLLKKIVQFVVGVLGYYIIWKLLLGISDLEAVAYQGIDKIGSFHIKNSILSMCKGLAKFFLDWNSKNLWTLSLYVVLMIGTLVFLVIVLVIAGLKNKIYKEKVRLLLLIASVIFLPFACCLLSFSTSGSLSYGARMLYSVVIIFVLLLLLAEKWAKGRLANMVGILMAMLIFVFSIKANVAYWYMQKAQEKTFANACIILEQAYDKGVYDEKKQKVMVIGDLKDKIAYSDEAPTRLGLFWGLLEKHMLYDGTRLLGYMNNTFELKWERVSSEEEKEILKNKEVEEMENWPSEQSMLLLDDVLIIRFE